MKTKIFITGLLFLVLTSCSSDKGGSDVIDKVVSIQFDQKEKVITKNASIDLFTELKIENTTKQDILWYVDNSKILRLDGSVATGLTDGEALVVAKVRNTNKQATIKVIVKEQFLQFKQDQLTIVSGINYDLNELVEHKNVTPNQTKWTSSDSGIVTVDDEGQLTSYREGEARVVVYVEGKSIKSEIRITVKKNQLENIAFPASTLEMYAMNNITIPFVAIPNGANTDGIKWEVENNSRIKVVGPGVLYSDELGSGVLIATLPNGVKKEVNIRVVSKGVLGIRTPYGAHLDIFEGRNIPLSLTLFPLGETYDGLEFSTDSPLISVNAQGVVYTTVGKIGKANVIIKAKDNPDVRATMEVEVHGFTDFMHMDINILVEKFNNDLYSGDGSVSVWKHFPEEVIISDFRVLDGYKKVIFSDSNSYKLDKSYSFSFERIYKPYIEYTVTCGGRREVRREELRSPI